MDEFPEMYSRATQWTLNDWAYRRMADTFEKLSDHDNAVRASEIALNINPFDLDYMVDHAGLLFEQGKVAEAREIITRILADDVETKYATAFKSYGLRHAITLAVKMGDLDLANQLFAKMLEHADTQREFLERQLSSSTGNAGFNQLDPELIKRAKELLRISA